MDERSKQLRRDTIKLMYEHHGSHYGGSLSCIEILIALYDHVMTEDDVFLLSKGHSVWPLYVLLREKGLNPTIEHHPKMDVANGINMTSGSLGHGIPFGIGVALAKKIKGEPGHVYVLCGDGETQEGTFYESMLIAHHNRLDNLSIIIDYNSIQGSDFVDSTLYTPFSSIAHACGWLFETIYGHDFDHICAKLGLKFGKPTLYTAITVKGNGISFMENKPEWHSRVMTEEEYNLAMEELK